MTKELNDYYMIKPSDDSLIIYPKILFQNHEEFMKSLQPNDSVSPLNNEANWLRTPFYLSIINPHNKCFQLHTP